MSGWSFQEVFLLVVIGLIVLGPKRLPQVANQIGSWIGQARRMTRMMKRQLEDEINFDFDSINVQKQLGLDDKPKPGRSRDADKPWFAQGSQPQSGDSPSIHAPEESAADGGAAKTELPDDYSPAHGSDDIGTGVGDETADNEQEPVVKAENKDVANGSAEPAGEKKETA